MEKISPDILIRAQKGELSAFEEIVNFFQKAIYSHLSRLISSPDDAADLTQETFIKLFKTRKRIDSTANFQSYLYKIATNTAYDWLRKKQRQPEDLIIDDENVNFETIEAKQSYYEIEAIDKLALEIALKEIKPNYRNLILLYYREGFNYEEISQITNQPLNTVKTGLSRAKQELFKKIA